MNWNTYISLFESILTKENTTAPYDKESYWNYTSLNFSRQNRWFKRGKLSDELVSEIENISEEQQWILITEPWCGDAAHINPFIQMASELNDKITLTINLRDGADSLIQDYLTNGVSMSIPILVVRDKNGEDLFVWGPRPKDAQALLMSHKTDDSKTAEEKKIEFQAWYNKNKGVDIQDELLAKFKSIREVTSH
ncbi:MAG: thioredoxin family protein [Crocinitomicaceae bacterium]|nr:thioredoxin family protein [Crocinitomicaceae bacterium]